jgi:hypothetical protein
MVSKCSSTGLHPQPGVHFNKININKRNKSDTEVRCTVSFKDNHSFYKGTYYRILNFRELFIFLQK